MKKLAKRLAAVLMAAVMTVGISMTAFADEGEGTTTPTTTTGSATLTVNGAGLAGKDVTAIRMFTARVTENKDNSANGFDSYTLDAAWSGFFKHQDRFAAVKNAGYLDENLTVDQISDVDLSNAAVAYVVQLSDVQTRTFAHKAQIWARDNATGLSSLTQTQKATNDTEDATKGTATFQNLTAGYYLVYPEGGSTGNDNRGTDALLVNVPEKGSNTSVEIKSTYPTVDKKVQTVEGGTFAQNGAAQVGDQVTFQLTSKVPDMTDYNKGYQFTFNDTLSHGLTFDANSVTVTVDGTKVTKDSDYTVVEPTGENGNKLTVKFDNLKTVDGATTDADIVVTYTAHITKDATTTDPAKNTVTVSYSNDPNTTGTGTSQPSESKVYTYQIDIDKYTGTYGTNGESATRLAGAVFQLEATKNGDAIELVKESENVYHVKGNGEEATDTTVTTVTSDGENKITIKGLKAGTYYLEELTAPTGYNKLTTPVTIVIATSDEKDATVTMEKAKYTVGTTPNGKAGDSTVAVKNNKGQMLPTTGSMGTIGLVALGVAVVLIGVHAEKKEG